jgi:hypothetical protein
MRKVPTYDRLRRHVRACTEGEIDSLLVFGRPGTGKSHAYRDALAGRPHHLFSARTTPIRVYIELHDDPSSPVVFDDVSALLRDNNFVDLLKNLCETGTRTVRWGTSTPLLEGRPNAFTCTAPVLIVLNRMPEDNADVMAVLDRCDGIEFDPPKPEVIARMREVFPNDGELIDLLAELPVIPSLRTLVKARRWQQSKHLDWRAELVAECGVPEAVSVLLRVMQEYPEGEWLDQYIRTTGLTDRTFRRHRLVADQVRACRASQNDCPNVRPGDNGHGLGRQPPRESPPLPSSAPVNTAKTSAPSAATGAAFDQCQTSVCEPVLPKSEPRSPVAGEGQPAVRRGSTGVPHLPSEHGDRRADGLGRATIQEFQVGTCAKPEEALS